MAPVDPAHLLEIEHARRLADRLDVEGGDQLVAREDLLITVRPAETREVVDETGRQEAEVAIRGDGHRPVALAEPRLVGAENQRHVAERGQVVAERLIEQDLARGVREMIVAADDVRDAHLRVVDDDTEVVGRGAVGAQNDEIVELGVLEDDGPFDEIVDDGFAVLRPAETHGVRTRVVTGREVAARPVVDGLLPRGERGGALRVEIGRAAVARIGAAFAQQALGLRDVHGSALALKERTLVPRDLEPLETFDDRGDRCVS